MAAKRKEPTFRVSGLPVSEPDERLKTRLTATITDNLTEQETSTLSVNVTVVPSCYTEEERAALVDFGGGVPAFLSELAEKPLSDWQIELDENTDVNFDQHFHGFTQLYTPAPDTPVTAEYVVSPCPRFRVVVP